MPTQAELDRALRVAEQVAREAGALAMKGWRHAGQVKHKGRFDLITDYDLQCEQLIRDRLRAEFPSHQIVGEEMDTHSEGELIWYVDPIDGTTNFVHGHVFFAMSIALYQRSRGLVAVVHAPALDVTWKACAGLGAFRNDERCEVSERSRLEQAVCATGFPYDRSNLEQTYAELALFLQRVRGVRRCGSAAIDLCLVADGTYDIYWERDLHAWDMCAGALMVVEAGGRLSDYEGGPADPRSGRLIASNGLLHDAAVQTIGEARHRVAANQP
ncbi:MAG: inositol monophosphatase family protein [Myxococcales bacterium]